MSEENRLSALWHIESTLLILLPTLDVFFFFIISICFFVYFLVLIRFSFFFLTAHPTIILFEFILICFFASSFSSLFFFSFLFSFSSPSFYSIFLLSLSSFSFSLLLLSPSPLSLSIASFILSFSLIFSNTSPLTSSCFLFFFSPVWLQSLSQFRNFASLCVFDKYVNSNFRLSSSIWYLEFIFFLI